MAKKLSPEQIYEKALELYNSMDNVYSLSAARHTAKMAAYLLVHMAANLLPIEEQRKFEAPKAPKKAKKKKDDDMEF